MLNFLDYEWIFTRAGPAGHSGRRSRPRGSLPRNRSIRRHLVTKCTVKQIFNQFVPSEQLKHVLNARKQSKTWAKRAKTVHLTRKMAKARQPSHWFQPRNAFKSINERVQSSTVSRFTGLSLSSVYPQLHNRDTFSVLNSFNRFAAKNKQVHPHNPNPGQLNSENVIPQIAIELLFFVSFLYDFIAEIGFRCINAPKRLVSGNKR